MNLVERMAFITVIRANGFAGLAIMCVMVGSSFDPKMAFRMGAVLLLMWAFFQILRGYTALQKDVRETELWILLEKQDRPQPEIRQQIIGGALRTAYYSFAHLSSVLAALLAGASIGLSLIGL